MALRDLFNFWSKKKEPEGLIDEVEIEKALFIKEAKRKMQRLDELTTASELEIELLSTELDKISDQEKAIRERIKELDKPDSHLERNLLMRTKRLQTHGDNLKQRIDIYHQNIELYLNMMSRIQDIQAMKMGDISDEKIASVWLEFKEELDLYREKLTTANTSNDDCKFQIETLENQLNSLRDEIFPERLPEKQRAKSAPEVKEAVKKSRESMEKIRKKKSADKISPEPVLIDSERELDYE